MCQQRNEERRPKGRSLFRRWVSKMRMKDRFNKVLVNPTWEEIVERDPIIAFSHYLSGRVHVLLTVADEITANLNQGFHDASVDGGRIERAELLMWLWTLGAYEVVRTMCQADKCFSETALSQLKQLKKALALIRMPAAKMEKAGKRVPVTSNRSPSGCDIQNRDLIVSDPESTSYVSARSILQEFDRVFSSIKKEDILGSHEESYGKTQQCH